MQIRRIPAVTHIKMLFVEHAQTKCLYALINAICFLYLTMTCFVITAGQRSTTPIHKSAWFIALLVLIALLLLVLLIFVLYTRHRGAKYPGKSIIKVAGGNCKVARALSHHDNGNLVRNHDFRLAILPLAAEEVI